MEQHRPFVLSIAGLDPSAGAGLLADIKTFEALGTYGLGVCTALTVQTDVRFISAEWQSAAQIIAQAQPLLESFPVQYCKIGIMKDVHTMLEVINTIKGLTPDIRIVLEPRRSNTIRVAIFGGLVRRVTPSLPGSNTHM